MKRVHVLVAIRLLAVLALVLNSAHAASALISTRATVAIDLLYFYFSLAVTVALVPVLLWFAAPILTRLMVPSDGEFPHQQNVSSANLVALGIFLIGINYFPGAASQTFATLWAFFDTPSSISGDELWRYGTSLRQNLAAGLTKLVISLIFIFGAKRIAKLYENCCSPQS